MALDGRRRQDRGRNGGHLMTATAPAGLWRLAGTALTAVEAWDVGPAIVLVPCEDVLLLTVDLPLNSRNQRRAALPYAIEDRIAEPLDTVHVALGTAVAPTTYLAGVVRQAIMARWVALLADAGLAHARLVPDALGLPIPLPGGWSVAVAGDRVLVRTDAGAGFATPAGRFAGVWAAGGSLPCTIYGPPPAFDLPLASIVTMDAVDLRAIAPALDLRDGIYAVPARPLPIAVRRLAAIVALGLLAHTTIAAADTLRLQHLAATQAATADALLRQALPGTPLTADLDRLLPTGADARGPLLPLLVRVAAALAPVGGLTFDKLAYSARDASLTLGVEAANIDGLQRAQAALATAGLNPVSGAVTAGSGRADGDIVVRGGPA